MILAMSLHRSSAYADEIFGLAGIGHRRGGNNLQSIHPTIQRRAGDAEFFCCRGNMIGKE